MNNNKKFSLKIHNSNITKNSNPLIIEKNNPIRYNIKPKSNKNQYIINTSLNSQKHAHTTYHINKPKDKLKIISNKIINIEKHMDLLDKNINSSNTNIHNLKDLYDNLNSNMKDINICCKTLDSKLLSMSTSIDSVSEKIEILDHKLGLTSTINTNIMRINNMNIIISIDFNKDTKYNLINKLVKLSNIKITNLSGFIQIDNFDDFNNFDIRGNISIFNLDTNILYSGLIIKDSNKIKYILSGRPLIPFGLNINGYFQIDLHIIKI